MATNRADSLPPWVPAVAATFSVQLGSALSVSLIDDIGPAGTAWLRLSMGALLFMALARPPLRSIRRGDLPGLVGLGIATGLMTVFFLSAVERIPLGTAVAIDFLGPLTVAAMRTRTPLALAWPGLALGGVVLLTEPWQGTIDPLGLLFAVLAAAGWGVYILLTQHVGDRFTGLGPLSITVAIGALTAAIIGIPQAAGHLTPGIVATAAGLAVLLPVVPYALELIALRRMTPAAFGTLMAIEPALGALFGLLVLAQRPTVAQAVGVALVVLAGIGAQRRGRRRLAPAS